MKINQCPCCNNSLLRHFRKGGSYWFCTNCWQEMPSSVEAEKVPNSKNLSTSKSLSLLTKSSA